MLVEIEKRVKRIPEAELNIKPRRFPIKMKNLSNFVEETEC